MTASTTRGNLQALVQEMHSHVDPFISDIPKVELHLHIEGTITPALRWKLAQRHGITLKSERTGEIYDTIEKLQASYELHRAQYKPGEGAEATFFELYYGGFEVLQTEEDFYDLAMNMFELAAKMNVRYVEPFFDPQGHTRRGVPLDAVMKGFRRAQLTAEKDLNVKSQWIMCMLRDMTLESATEHYEAALPYRDMIVAIGLDSMEEGHPPSQFYKLFERARADGFKLTCHCDPGVPDTMSNMEQVLNDIGGTGADRCDHGLSAAHDPQLVQGFVEKKIGMTLCPWAYFCLSPETDIMGKVRQLYDAGVQVTINSDDPAYMDGCWIVHNLHLARLMCGFSDADIVRLQRNAVDMCWAPQEVKSAITKELEEFAARNITGKA
ncbi:adenosine deaminase [Capronia coronata CBS 617.96]|uniref:Adenosine deaminase n=1 Tax=Capronia coronata CBS 617.96 TaxID=1182541 RepID=W9YQC5_9EURO|nr:adenosine deaminase [Capronia coronata CBS 617.96]EXJ91446.1 adenosine deaminase [Capronia coronata CBS 617.96]